MVGSGWYKYEIFDEDNIIMAEESDWDMLFTNGFLFTMTYLII